MIVQDFLNLSVGQTIYDPRYNTYGEVCEGDWQNCLQSHLKGSGKYIHWFDDDNCKVGIAIHTAQEIAHYELYDGKIT